MNSSFIPETTNGGTATKCVNQRESIYELCEPIGEQYEPLWGMRKKKRPLLQK
jgi:hypothetical protein